MSNIAEIIGWKFGHQGGMRCAGNAQGALEIVEFPGGIPTQAEIDQWTAEYEARDVDAERVDRAFRLDDKDRVLLGLLFEMINRILVLEGNPTISQEQFKVFLKSKLP